MKTSTLAFLVSLIFMVGVWFLPNPYDLISLGIQLLLTILYLWLAYLGE